MATGTLFPKNFWNEVTKLQDEIKFVYRNVSTDWKNEKDSSELLQAIEDVIIEIVNSISQESIPFLHFRSRRNWDNVKFSPLVGLTVKTDAAQSYICLNKKSHKKFGIFVKTLSIIYKLIQTNEIATKRDIYYHYPELFGSQDKLDAIVDDIGCMLNVPRHCLNIIATSKGCIAGDVTFMDGDEFVNCLFIPGGKSIPLNVKNVKDIGSRSAKFVLVIEKDATFQCLMDSKITSLLPCILITGKGYPDVNTRKMVKLLWDHLKLPTFLLVDADPYGLEIMCVYRYGSMALSYDVENLAVPSARWLGVLPSDMQKLSMAQEHLLTLTEKDKSRCRDMLSRPYTKDNNQMKNQINFLLETGKKAEIQTLNHISPSYLINNYIYSKLKQGDWI